MIQTENWLLSTQRVLAIHQTRGEDTHEFHRLMNVHAYFLMKRGFSDLGYFPLRRLILERNWNCLVTASSNIYFKNH
jgi:hypothetical protein